MSEQDMKRMMEFDNAADKAGGYVSPLFKDNANYHPTEKAGWYFYIQI